MGQQGKVFYMEAKLNNEVEGWRESKRTAQCSKQFL